MDKIYKEQSVPDMDEGTIYHCRAAAESKTGKSETFPLEGSTEVLHGIFYGGASWLIHALPLCYPPCLVSYPLVRYRFYSRYPFCFLFII